MPVARSPTSIVRKNSAGSDIQRRRLNLIEGTNVTLTVSDDSANNEIDVTIAASGTGGGATTALDNLASVAINAALLPGSSNSIALGSTSKQWSDLFLGEGAVIEWDGGDATMTQTGDDITFAGITTFGVGISTAVTLGTIELGHATNTTLSQSAPGVLAVEGVDVLTVTNTLTGITNKTLTSPKITNSVGNAAGSIEFNGKVFVSTPIASATGLSPSMMFAAVTSGNFNLQTTSGVQSAFPTTSDVWTLAANTSYFIEGQYRITHTTSTCTVAMAFANTSIIIGFWVGVQSCIVADNGTATASNMSFLVDVSSHVVTITSTANFLITFSGILTTGGSSGTVTPQISFSANTTAPAMVTGSFIRFTPYGADTTEKLGNVA